MADILDEKREADESRQSGKSQEEINRNLKDYPQGSKKRDGVDYHTNTGHNPNKKPTDRQQ